MEKRPNTPFDFKGFDDWIEVFRGGVQTDSAGNTREFTDADLDSVIANHNPEHPAPIVVGHPQGDAPAYGWTSELKRDGKTLLAKFAQVEPQFEKLVKDGRYRNRSVRLLPASNGFKLDHVGWLGAAPPAIEGLKPAFTKVDGGATYDFSFRDARRASMLARSMRRLRDLFIEKFGADDAERAVPEDSITGWENLATAEEVDATLDLHSPDDNDYAAARGQSGRQEDATVADDPKNFTQADIDAAKAAAKKEAEDKAASDYSALDEKHKKLEYERRLDSHKAAIDKAVDAGRLTPAQAQGCAEFMASLPAGEDAQFEFSAVPAKKGDDPEQLKRDPAKWFADFLAKLPEQVPMNQRLKPGDAPDNGAAFTAAPGVDPDRAKLHQAALDYQREHPKTPYVDAVKAVDPNA